MRMGVLVVAACVLLPRAAGAGAVDDAEALWGKDMRNFALAFDFPGDKSAWGDTSLGKAEITCTDVSSHRVYDVLGSMTSACTASIPSSDATECRVAAMTAIAFHRWEELGRGDDSGFTFEVTCEGYVLKGEVHPYSEQGWTVLNGRISAEETDTGGGNIGSYELHVTWEKVPPDPTDPIQWRHAVLVPVWRIDALITALARAIKEGNAKYAEEWRDYLADEAAAALADEQGFPELPDDDSIRTASIEWLTDVQADADHGDQKLLVDRMSHGKKQTKAYKRKTQAIAKRWKKARDERNQTLNGILDAFDAAHAAE